MVVKKKLLGILIGISSAFLYGLYPAAVRHVYQDGGNAMAMFLSTNFSRLFAMLLMCYFTKQKLFQHKEIFRTNAIGGFFQTLATGCIMASLLTLPGGVMISIIFLYPLCLLFIHIITGLRSFDFSTLIITALALLGLTFVLDVWYTQSLNVTGILLAFLGMISTTIRFYLFGKSLSSYNPSAVGAETFVWTCLFALLGLFIQWPVLPDHLVTYKWVLLACLSMAFATIFMFYGIALLGSFEFSMIAKLEPIFTTVLSIFLLHETLHNSQYIGILVVIVSLVAYQYISHKQGKNERKKISTSY
jgi:drug/metabolite transporter (DMT)-like permease